MSKKLQSRFVGTLRPERKRKTLYERAERLTNSSQAIRVDNGVNRKENYGQISGSTPEQAGKEKKNAIRHSIRLCVSAEIVRRDYRHVVQSACTECEKCRAHKRETERKGRGKER